MNDVVESCEKSKLARVKRTQKHIQLVCEEEATSTQAAKHIWNGMEEGHWSITRADALTM